MKKLIYQYTNKETSDLDEEYQKCCYQSVQKYAEKIGADYKLYRVPFYVYKDFCDPHYGIFYPFMEELNFINQYDKICFLDYDMLVTVNAPDVFLESDASIVGCYNLTSFNTLTERMHDFWQDSFIELLKITQFPSVTTNTGLVIWDKRIFETFKAWLDENWEYWHKRYWFDNDEEWQQIVRQMGGKNDQTMIVTFIRDMLSEQFRKEYDNTFPFTEHLDNRYNWRLNKFDFESRFDAYIIHYMDHYSEDYLVRTEYDKIIPDEFKNEIILK